MTLANTLKKFAKQVKQFWQRRSMAGKAALAIGGMMLLGAGVFGVAAVGTVMSGAVSGLCVGFILTYFAGSTRSMVAGPVTGAAVALLSLTAQNIHKRNDIKHQNLLNNKTVSAAFTKTRIQNERARQTRPATIGEGKQSYILQIKQHVSLD